MQKIFFFSLLVLFNTSVFSQPNTGARLFLDLPELYAVAPDAEHVKNLVGLGLGTAMNVGTHWSVVRVGGGAHFTVDPQVKEFQESFQITPFVLLEGGAGMYRSNGNRCAKTRQNAFTALAKVGLRYSFYSKDVREITNENGAMDYTVGGEFGYFFIRDMFRNNEVFLNSVYLTKSKAILVSFGLKMFLNLRANR